MQTDDNTQVGGRGSGTGVQEVTSTLVKGGGGIIHSITNVKVERISLSSRTMSQFSKH